MDDGKKARRRVPMNKPSSYYTVEQLNVVREIMSEKDYYRILRLKRSCSTKDARQAYRKLCLKVHPDKNKAPGAEEAFKIVNKAFQCLSDEQSRKKYDCIRSEEPIYERKNGGGSGTNEKQNFETFHEWWFDMDSLAVQTICALLIFLFILFVFVPLWLTLFPREHTAPPAPIYSNTVSDSYNYSITTQKGVSFYVQSANFELQYPPNSPKRVEIEERVEIRHHSLLFHMCKGEMRYFYKWGTRRKSPNCDALRQLEAMFE